jgi:alkaline phosphatase
VTTHPLARLLALTVSTLALLLGPARSDEATSTDRLRDLQNSYVASKDEKQARAYHFGSQGAGDVFTNHASHTNRMVPVYIFGTKADLGAVTGPNSRYRTEDGVRSLYGRVPEHTVNPQADYADQSDLYRVQLDAVERGAKYVFTVWFDGFDWDTTRAAAIARSGKVYNKGKGTGLAFQDYTQGNPQFGYVVTSPTHVDPRDDQFNVDTQTVADLGGLLGGGYDARFAGPNPWTPGPLAERAPGYLKGQNGHDADKSGVLAAGGTLHAYTDSSCSAAEYATGVKAYNNGVNVADDGRLVETLYQKLQRRGWEVGTVTSVPFNHASPAAMYAHNVSRDDYQDLAREMLGLESIVQQTGKGPRLPGLDVVIGCGWGVTARNSDLKKQGGNAVSGNNYITSDDLAEIDLAQGGPYVVAQRTAGARGYESLASAAQRAAEEGRRLFGFYGTRSGHLPYRTADGGYDPSKSYTGVAEVYQPADLLENPSLAEMARAALTVLSAEPGRPFALFVEAGDVDFALHENNLDNAIGATISGEEAVKVVFDWVERHSNWDESVVIVTADHGHYLVLDDPTVIAGAAR